MADLFTVGYWHYYAQLPQHVKSIYMQIYNGLKARRTDFTFYVEKHNGIYPPNDMITKIFTSVIKDNPALYDVDGVNIQLFYSYSGMGRVRVKYTEYYSPQQHEQMERAFRVRMAAILEAAGRQKDDYRKVREIYRNMVTTVATARGLVETDNVKRLEAHTVVGPMLRRAAVCAGYSKMFKLMCDQIGIPCIIVYGPAQGAGGWAPHAWNAVRLQGKFYHLDVTFDSSDYQSTRQFLHRYYLLGNVSFRKDHKWEQAQIPTADQDYPRKFGWQW